MDSSVLERILTIEEVKQKMKDVREAAVHYGGIVHCGERGRDELVIVSLQTWRKHAGRESLPTSYADPYAAFSRALEEGRIGIRGSGPERRRRIPDLRDRSDLTVEEMIAAGAEPITPRRRRSS